MFGDSIAFNQAFVVCIFSLAVVFVVLLVLSTIVELTSRIVSYFRGE